MNNFPDAVRKTDNYIECRQCVAGQTAERSFGLDFLVLLHPRLTDVKSGRKAKEHIKKSCERQRRKMRNKSL